MAICSARLGVPLWVLTVAVGVAAADPPANDPGSDIFDMRKPGSVVTPPATRPADTPPAQTPTPPEPPPAQPPTVPPVSPPANGKLPTPSAAAGATAARAVADAYSADSAAARSVDARAALAVKMLAAAADEADPANRYELFALARDTAAGAGDLRLAGWAVDAAASQYDVDGPRLKAAAAAACLRATVSPADRRETVLRAATLGDGLVAAGRPELTAGIDAGTAAAAAGLRDAGLSAELRVQAAAHTQACADAAAVARAHAVLKGRPADKPANTVVGRYACLTRGDWAGGLAMLAAGEDGPLRAAAVADAAGPGSVDAQLAVGDAWLAAAKATPSQPDRSRLLERAGHWYDLAGVGQTGLTATRVQKRQAALATAAAAGPAAGGPPPVVDLLALVDPARDTGGGTWTLAGPDLVSGSADGTKIDLPYHPPHEYDVRVTFTRDSGNDGLDVICCGGGDGRPGTGRPFKFTLGGWDNTVAGFALVEGHWAKENPTTTHGRWLVNGRRQTLVVQVRADHVAAVLDDRPIVTFKTDDCRALSQGDETVLHRRDVLGLQAWDSGFTIHSADLIEVTGRGEPSRADDPAASAVVARLSYLGPGNNRRPGMVDLHADGQITADGKSGLWYERGNVVTFQWGEALDVCTLSPNRKSFAGRNQAGDRITGSVTTGSL